jgi:hypothetical protein
MQLSPDKVHKAIHSFLIIELISYVEVEEVIRVLGSTPWNAWNILTGTSTSARERTEWSALRSPTLDIRLVGFHRRSESCGGEESLHPHWDSNVSRQVTDPKDLPNDNTNKYNIFRSDKDTSKQTSCDSR